MDRARTRLLRRSEVRSTSITELMLIIIFVFLMILGAARVDLSDSERHIENLREDLAEALSELERFRQAIREDDPITALTTLRRDHENLAAKARLLERRNRQLDTAVAKLESENEALSSRLMEMEHVREILAGQGLADDRGVVDRDRVEEIIEMAEDREKVRQALGLPSGSDGGDLVSRVEQVRRFSNEVARRLGVEGAGTAPEDVLDAATRLTRERRQTARNLGLPPDAPPAEITRAARAAQSRLEASRRAAREYSERLSRAEQRGQGIPECWRRGRSEYLLSVIVSDDGYEIRGGWSRERDAEARTIPGIREIQRRIRTVELFKRLAAPIRDHGIGGDFPCLYTVRLHDATSATNKRGWKTRSRVLRNYFHAFEFKDRPW